MQSWKSILILPDTSIGDAIKKIDEAGTQMALIVDASSHLLGSLSDGDIRRGFLAGMKLNDPVKKCMCSTPTIAKQDEASENILKKMRSLSVHQIPVVDDKGRVIDLKTIHDFLTIPERDNWVVIMAGGLGSRLKELTRDTPKPMLKVGNRPLLETIVSRFVEQGFRKIWLAVNYHAEQIEEYFGDGSKFGAKVQYVREDKRLGTAGALSLLPKLPDLPLLITNADLLVTADYGEMLDDHIAKGVMATMAVREYEYQIPYGVVRTIDNRIESLEEKPVHQAMVNAGIYVLSPDALKSVPNDTFFDMPELFVNLLNDAKPVSYYQLYGYWLDIGRHEDYHKANGDFPEVFL